MAYTYPAMVAWDSTSKQAVKNGSFQVYATTDTAFLTPLPITDPFGAPLTGNILNSGSQGVFPPFQQATNATVVIANSTKTQSWTVIAIQPPTQDASVATFLNDPSSATNAALMGFLDPITPAPSNLALAPDGVPYILAGASTIRVYAGTDGSYYFTT